MFPGNEDLKHHRLQPRDFIYWKRYPTKTLFNHIGKEPTLVPPSPKERLLDAYVASKESAKPWLNLHTNWWPENKDFQELKPMTAKGNENTFPRWLDQACILFSHYCISLYSSLSHCNLSQNRETFLTVGSATGNSDLFMMLEISWSSIYSPTSKANVNKLTPLCKTFRKDSFKLGWFHAECLLLILFCIFIFKLYTCCLSSFCSNDMPNRVMLA